MKQEEPLASVIVPAHNEERGITRLLEALRRDSSADELEIIVVCNGCTDATASLARAFDRNVLVIETPVPSKAGALHLGDQAAHHVPRIFLDADVEFSAADVRALVSALSEPGVLAVGPERVLPLDGVTWLVRRYYATWLRLPAVRTGLFGRGVIAFSEEGLDRVRALPPVMADDLAFSEAFTASERRVAPAARVIVRPPRTARDLLRRRIRVHTGNAQLDGSGLRKSAAKTSLSDLTTMVRTRPSSVVDVTVFLSITIVARIAARRRIRSGDFTTWLRDESSRQ
jgi:glycosyltransferase involved in cell wall biosynthesis